MSYQQQQQQDPFLLPDFFLLIQAYLEKGDVFAGKLATSIVEASETDKLSGQFDNPSCDSDGTTPARGSKHLSNNSFDEVNPVHYVESIARAVTINSLQMQERHSSSILVLGSSASSSSLSQQQQQHTREQRKQLEDERHLLLSQSQQDNGKAFVSSIMSQGAASTNNNNNNNNNNNCFTATQVEEEKMNERDAKLNAHLTLHCVAAASFSATAAAFLTWSKINQVPSQILVNNNTSLIPRISDILRNTKATVAMAQAVLLPKAGSADSSSSSSSDDESAADDGDAINAKPKGKAASARGKKAAAKKAAPKKNKNAAGGVDQNDDDAATAAISLSEQQQDEVQRLTQHLLPKFNDLAAWAEGCWAQLVHLLLTAQDSGSFGCSALPQLTNRTAMSNFLEAAAAASSAQHQFSASAAAASTALVALVSAVRDFLDSYKQVVVGWVRIALFLSQDWEAEQFKEQLRAKFAQEDNSNNNNNKGEQMDGKRKAPSAAAKAKELKLRTEKVDGAMKSFREDTHTYHGGFLADTMMERHQQREALLRQQQSLQKESGRRRSRSVVLSAPATPAPPAAASSGRNKQQEQQEQQQVGTPQRSVLPLRELGRVPRGEDSLTGDMAALLRLQGQQSPSVIIDQQSQKQQQQQQQQQDQQRKRQVAFVQDPDVSDILPPENGQRGQEQEQQQPAVDGAVQVRTWALYFGQKQFTLESRMSLARKTAMVSAATTAATTTSAAASGALVIKEEPSGDSPKKSKAKSSPKKASPGKKKK